MGHQLKQTPAGWGAGLGQGRGLGLPAGMGMGMGMGGGMGGAWAALGAYRSGVATDGSYPMSRWYLLGPDNSSPTDKERAACGTL